MTALHDLKEALSSARKPDLTHVRTAFMIYTCRPCSYGDDKYERGNYMRQVNGGSTDRADFLRFRAYLRAAMSHISQTLDAMEAHQANDPQLLDVRGMRTAAYAADTDETPGARVGASMLPHVSMACASLNMAITQAVKYGLLPADPGRTWQMKTTEDTKPAATTPVIPRRDPVEFPLNGVQADICNQKGHRCHYERERDSQR